MWNVYTEIVPDENKFLQVRLLTLDCFDIPLHKTPEEDQESNGWTMSKKTVWQHNLWKTEMLEGNCTKPQLPAFAHIIIDAADNTFTDNMTDSVHLATKVQTEIEDNHWILHFYHTTPC